MRRCPHSRVMVEGPSTTQIWGSRDRGNWFWTFISRRVWGKLLAPGMESIREHGPVPLMILLAVPH